MTARVPRQSTGRCWNGCGLGSSDGECSSRRRSLRRIGCTSASNSPKSTIRTTRQLGSRFAGTETTTSTSITRRSVRMVSGSVGGIDTRMPTTRGITSIRHRMPAAPLRRMLSGREIIEMCVGSSLIALKSVSKRCGNKSEVPRTRWCGASMFIVPVRNRVSESGYGCVGGRDRFSNPLDYSLLTSVRRRIVPGGFEPPSMAPKAIMIGHYTTGLRMGLTRPSSSRLLSGCGSRPSAESSTTASGFRRSRRDGRTAPRTAADRSHNRSDTASRRSAPTRLRP